MNLHNICLSGAAFPSERARFPHLQHPAWGPVAGQDGLEPARWTGTHGRDSLAVSPWETWAGNAAAAGCGCETFRFHFSRGPCLGTVRSRTRSWLIPSSLLQSLLIPLIPVLLCRRNTWGVWPVDGEWFGVWHTVLQLILENSTLS